MLDDSEDYPPKAARGEPGAEIEIPAIQEGQAVWRMSAGPTEVSIRRVSDQLALHFAPDDAFTKFIGRPPMDATTCASLFAKEALTYLSGWALEREGTEARVRQELRALSHVPKRRSKNHPGRPATSLRHALNGKSTRTRALATRLALQQTPRLDGESKYSHYCRALGMPPSSLDCSAYPPQRGNSLHSSVQTFLRRSVRYFHCYSGHMPSGPYWCEIECTRKSRFLGLLVELVTDAVRTFPQPQPPQHQVDLEPALKALNGDAMLAALAWYERQSEWIKIQNAATATTPLS